MFNLYNYKLMKKKWFNDEGPNRSLFKWLRIMKLTVLFLLAALLQVSASVYSQQTKLSLSLKDASVREVLRTIEDQSEFFFLYKNENIDVNRIVNVDIKEKSVEYLLDQVFKGTSVSYEVVNRQIVLTDNEKDNDFDQSVSQQNAVSGKVTDSSGQPLPGVSVVIKGTVTGTITDINGGYSMTRVPENTTLQFSFVGMKTLEITVEGKTIINVTLAEETIGIDEVVAIGYGTMKKRDVIGSISSVTAKDLEKSSVTNVQQAMQGRTAGVIVTQQSGQPGSDMMVEIRGAGGFGSQSPLYIVDGYVGASVSSLNPSDIESIDVLKDAGTAAIYGARGANGVVIVTTKRAKSGPVKVKFDTYFGIQNLAKKMDVLDTRQYIDFINQSKIAAGGLVVPQFGTTEKINELAKINTDWQDQIFKENAQVRNHNLNISGGSENATFSFSLNNLDQTGILIDSYYKRYSVRFNSDFKAGKYLKFGESFSFVRSQRQTNDNGMDWTNPINTALKFPPYLTPYDTDPNSVTHIAGNTGGWPSGVQSWEGNDLSNPLGSKLNEFKPQNNELQGNVYAQVNFTKNLYYKINVGINYSNYYNSLYRPKYFSGPYSSNSNPSISKNGDYNQNILIENTINFNTTFLNHHNVSMVAGVSKQKFNSEFFSLGTNELPNESVRNIGTGSGSLTRTIGGGENGYRLTSIFGRANYDYDNKYLFSATFRRDGSSRFGPDNKFGLFPAFSMGWRISQESFMENINFITDLKIFGSWGKLGSDNIADFQYTPTVNIGSNNYNLGGTGIGNEVLYYGSKLSGFANPRLQWQANVTSNLGLSMALFNNKISLNVEYYKKTTDKLIQNVTIPATSGYPSMYMNAGSVENKGIDLQLTYRDKIGGFHYDVVGNFSTLKNNVISLGSPTAIFGGMILPNQLLITKTDVGQPIGSFWGYQAIGIYKMKLPSTPQLTLKVPDPVICNMLI